MPKRPTSRSASKASREAYSRVKQAKARMESRLTVEERRRRTEFVELVCRGLHEAQAAELAGYPIGQGWRWGFYLMQVPYIRAEIVIRLQHQGVAWRGMLQRAKAILYEGMNPLDPTLTPADRRDAAKAVIFVLGRGGRSVADEAEEEDVTEEQLRLRATEIVLGPESVKALPPAPEPAVKDA